MKIKIATAFLLCASCAFGVPSDLPDAPSASSRPPEATTGHPAPAFDRQLWIASGAHFLVRAADDAQTCNTLAHGGREYSFPTQSCAGVVLMNTAVYAGTVFASWELARHGHRRMAYAVQWIGVAVDAGYFASSIANRNTRRHR